MNSFTRNKQVKLILLLGVSAFGYCQAPAKDVTKEDYEKWSVLTGQSISADGKWISYKNDYDVRQDTTFIRNLKTKKEYIIPDGGNASFSKCGRWVAVTKSATDLLLYDLEFGKEVFVKDFISFSFSQTRGGLAVLKKEGESNELLVYSAAVAPLVLKDIKEYKYNVNGDLALVYSEGLKLIKHHGASSPTILKTGLFKKIEWSKDGRSLVFFENTSTVDADKINQIVHVYNSEQGVFKTMNFGLRGNVEQKIVTGPSEPLVISEEGTKVFFYVDSITKNDAKQGIVQIWDTTSPLEYQQMEHYKDLQAAPKLSYWNIETDKVGVIATKDEPDAKMLPGYNHMLSFSRVAYAHSYEGNPPTDYYMTSLATMEKKLFLENFTTEPYRILPSPNGAYIAYFRDGDYWLYDVNEDQHFNVTNSGTFDDVEYDDAGKSFGYTMGGWSADGKSLFVYDAFDVWKITTDSKKCERITNGRSSKIQYRICDEIYRVASTSLVTEVFSKKLDFSSSLIMEAFGQDYQGGYFLYTENGGLKKITYGNARVRGIVKSLSTNTYLYLEETFSNPPKLMITDQKSLKSKTLVQSNAHFKNYNWGSSKVIYYKNSKGEQLKGALYFPSQFVAGKKYPMIVKIYERLSNRYNRYVNPSNYDQVGFTHTNYVLDGYFVFMPDIKYEIGDPFVSASDCVTSAVNTVIQTGMIDSSRVGIIGHSFGGSEVSFILTRSSLFATAVAGAPSNDFFSSYLTMNFNFTRSLGWKYESQQFRMGFSPFSNFEAYIRNSALMNASKINTPLLSYTGIEDSTIFWEQSLSLHLALRRLKKPSILLAYPDEQHVLWNMDNRADLSERIKNWFDDYLKKS